MSQTLEYIILGAGGDHDYPMSELAQPGIPDILKCVAVSSLRILVVLPESLPKLKGLPTVCPSLERLRFIYSPSYPRMHINLAKPSMKVLSKLQKLTHLGGFVISVNMKRHQTFDKLLEI
ncbi:hypothetical protein M422DRAFT_240413 [Sphaerobolus stellatus SS14]|nr:hypothetical protein M422DRAFT_240413 [Sphaerobolus stellatus SS14]